MKYIRNCEPCRRNKIKCDRKQPCGPCSIRHNTQACRFVALPSEGRPPTAPVYTSSRSAALTDGDSEAGSHQASPVPFPDDYVIDALADVYFAEQDKNTVSYVMTRSDFDRERVNAATDPACRSLVYVICGVGSVFLINPDPFTYKNYFEMAEDLLQICDMDHQPRLIHVRIYLLLLVGQGPLCGPRAAAARLQRAVYIAHVLNLHLSPSVDLPMEERKDRILLFATLAKADWFGALGLDQTFCMVRWDSPSLLPLCDASVRSSSHDDIDFNFASRMSLQMANLCRRMIERSSMTWSLSFKVTMELQTELLVLEGRTRPTSLFNPSSTTSDARNKMTSANATLGQMMFANLRRALHQPFHQLGWTDPTYRASRDICFQSAIANLELLAQLLGNWLSLLSLPSSEGQNGSSERLPVGVTIIWFHIVNYIRCALLVHRHLGLLQDAEDAATSSLQSSSSESDPRHGSAVPATLTSIDISGERGVAQRALSSARATLRALAEQSVIAREGLEALQQQPSSSTSTFTARQDIDTHNGAHTKSRQTLTQLQPTQQISPVTPAAADQSFSPSSTDHSNTILLNNLAVFDDVDDHDLWATFAWLGPGPPVM